MKNIPPQLIFALKFSYISFLTLDRVLAEKKQPNEVIVQLETEDLYIIFISIKISVTWNLSCTEDVCKFRILVERTFLLTENRVMEFRAEGESGTASVIWPELRPLKTHFLPRFST